MMALSDDNFLMPLPCLPSQVVPSTKDLLEKPMKKESNAKAGVLALIYLAVLHIATGGSDTLGQTQIGCYK